MRRYFVLVGFLVLMLPVIAACGDDDDNGDIDIPDQAETAVSGAADQAETAVSDVAEEVTEAAADDTEPTATTADDDATPTEEATAAGMAGTADADATGTMDDDSRATSTSDDATRTDDATSTVDGDATATGDDRAGATRTGDDDDDFDIGEPVTLGDFIFTVNDVMVLDTGGVVAPDPGNRFLGVELTIENTGSDPVALSRVLSQLYLEDDDDDGDDDDQRYAIDLAATAVAVFSGAFDASADIDAGSEVTGVAGFQVPEDEDIDDLDLVIEDEDGETVRVDLDDVDD